MTCRSATSLFSDQIEGTLDNSRSTRLMAHLESCAACAALFEIMELNTIQLQGTPEADLPDGLERRLALIPQRERAAARASGATGQSGGHWLFSNAMASGLLAVFIVVNLTWFNPGFQDSIRGCRELISDRSSRALELASGWSADLHHLKEAVEYRMERVRNEATRSEKGITGAEDGTSAKLVNEIIRALGLIGT